MAGYIGTQALRVNTTSATISDDLAVGDDATVAGDATVTGVITGSTVEATGDTAAGDNAAIGYTSAEGLILTGQGSTSDITLKNDADATVFTVPTGTDDILFPDSAKAMFGAGSDLQIYHDGGGSYITNGTGILRLQGKAGENSISLNPDGSAELYHNNVKKIETTATGVAVVAGGTYTTAAGNDLNLVAPDGRSIFFKEASATHATINNAGNLLVGATSVFGASRATIQCASGDQALSLKTAKTTGSEAILLFADGDNDTCGNITINTGSQQAALANGSDYRLKTDVQPMTGAATRVQALNPVNFEWLSDGSRIDGFLAHEAQAVVPDAVFGTHNATKTLTNVVISSSNRVLSENIEQSDWTAGKSATTDEDGNAVAAIYPSNSTWAAEHVVPEMQMMDHTKMIPLLVASLQEALARIETLESKVAVLEG